MIFSRNLRTRITRIFFNDFSFEDDFWSRLVFWFTFILPNPPPVAQIELSLGGSFGGLSRERSRLPFPDDPLDPDPAMLQGSSSGTGMRGRFRISMAGRGFLTAKNTKNKDQNLRRKNICMSLKLCRKDVRCLS